LRGALQTYIYGAPLSCAGRASVRKGRFRAKTAWLGRGVVVVCFFSPPFLLFIFFFGFLEEKKKGKNKKKEAVSHAKCVQTSQNNK